MEELREKTPFHCIISGPTNCGKTKFLIDSLRGSYRGVFKYVVLICPTYENNETYDGFAYGDYGFVPLSPASDEIIETLSDCKTFFAGFETLIILDDCAFSKDMKQRSNELVELAFHGRHDKISVWVLTQQLTSISKSFRENVGFVVSFYNPSTISNQVLFDEYGEGIDKETKKEYVKLLKSKKYSKIIFCLRHPYGHCVEIPATFQ
jgi:hypothetical protein